MFNRARKRHQEAYPKVYTYCIYILYIQKIDSSLKHTKVKLLKVMGGLDEAFGS
jgi:Gpi18-like mannosyltransferase